MLPHWIWNEAGLNDSGISYICNTLRYLSKRVHFQPGGHLSGALQRHLQPTNVTHVADQIPRSQGDQRHMAALLPAHGAVPDLQHARALPPQQQQHGQHVPPHLAQRPHPAVMVTFADTVSPASTGFCGLIMIWSYRSCSLYAEIALLAYCFCFRHNIRNIIL